MMKCGLCRKRVSNWDAGVVEVKGEPIDHPEMCEICYRLLFGYQPKVIEVSKQVEETSQIDVSELFCVVVSPSPVDVRICDFRFVDTWLTCGYTLFGAADSQEDIQELYHQAKGVKSYA